MDERSKARYAEKMMELKLKEALQQGLINVIKNMTEKNIHIETIEIATGLSQEEILKIQKQFKS